MKMTQNTPKPQSRTGLFARFQKPRRPHTLPRTIRHWTPDGGFVALPLWA